MCYDRFVKKEEGVILTSHQCILVTGGAGFIGSHTVDQLLHQGHRVIVFDNLCTGKLDYLDLFHPALEVIQGDILDYPKLYSQIKKCDAVLHLAALPSVVKSIEDPIESMKVNSLGFLHILQAIREAKKRSRLVYASSAAVYGTAETLPCDDQKKLSDVLLSPYAIEKANNERYADLYARLWGIKSIGLRYFNVYGNRQDPHSPYSGAMTKFISQYKKNKPITIFGDGKQSRDFIHVSDVAHANLLALQSDYHGVLNIATGIPQTLLQLVHAIEKSGGKSAEITWSALREGDILQSYARIDNAKKQLSFHPKVSLTEGIELIMTIGI